MTEPCRHCVKPLVALDAAILLGDRGYRELAEDFDSQKDQINTHLRHIKATPELRAAIKKAADRTTPARIKALRLDELDGTDAPSLAQILQRMVALEGLAVDTLADLRARGDFRSADASIRTCESLVSSIAKLAGFMSSNTATVVVLAQSPEFVALQNRLVQSLSPWPEAMQAAASALALPVPLEGHVVKD